jgi:uncharacterized protein YlxW (UPF0749 family)
MDAGRRPVIYVLIAVTALAFGFFFAAQLRVQLIAPSNRLERDQALIRTVSDLERSNQAYRDRITRLRSDIAGEEARASQRSAAARQLEDEVAVLRAHAGLTTLRGPGVTLDVRDGRRIADDQEQTGYLVNFQDVQDLVNLLFSGGAEGVSVNGHRISPLSGYRGTSRTVVIDQGPPVTSPFHVAAVGNRRQMEQLLGDPSKLGDLRFRQRQFGIQLSWSGSPDVRLPAYDSALEAADAHPN